MPALTARVDPPFAADEATTLRAFLDYFRNTLRRQTDGLDAAALAARLEPSTLTLGGLLKHLAFVESYWCDHLLAGNEQGEPWASADWETDNDWEMTSALHDTPEQLRALFDAEVATSDGHLDRAIATIGLDGHAARLRREQTVNVRWILVHLIEEYARHTGHADLIRESIDGATDL